jgi:hypothetical protein
MTGSDWARRWCGVTALLSTFAVAGTASAQSLGTFRWQTQPYCNVLTVSVTVSGQAYRLEGTDDGCGSTTASVIGMAYPKADGSVGVGLTLVSPGAVALHLDATIVPAAGFNGSWADSAGRSGTWLLTAGAVTGGSPRPVVSALQYGATVVQPAGGADRGLSVAVGTDTGVVGDAAALYGRFGAPLPPGIEGAAGVRGESAATAGVFGRSATGIGVVGGANTGIGVQGHAVAASGIGMQAHHLEGGTAFEINNGSIKVAGAVRAAFRVTLPGGGVPGNTFACTHVSHPLLDFDPTALVLVTPHFNGNAIAKFDTGDPPGRWEFCGQNAVGGPASVLVIKQ